MLSDKHFTLRPPCDATDTLVHNQIRFTVCIGRRYAQEYNNTPYRTKICAGKRKIKRPRGKTSYGGINSQSKLDREELQVMNKRNRMTISGEWFTVPGHYIKLIFSKQSYSKCPNERKNTENIQNKCSICWAEPNLGA